MLGKTERADTRGCLQFGHGKFPAIKLIVIALLSSITMASASHFVVPYTKTGSYMTVLADTSIHPTIDGVALQDSDEIGVFDSAGLCVGAGVWTGTNNVGITVWGQTSAGNGTTDSGMPAGQVLQYRLWSKSAHLEVHAAATYTTGTGADTNNTYITNGLLYLAGLSGYSVPGTPLLSIPVGGAINQPISLTLTWTSGSGGAPASYAVMVSTSASFSTTVFSRSGITSGNEPISGLLNSTAYYWEVSASNISGTSSWSTASSFTTIIATPVVPTLATPASGSVNQPISLSLNWGAVTGAATYSVMVSTAANFATTVSSQAGLTGTSASLSSLANSTQYYWEVNAANVGGTSNWSGAWSFTTIVAVPGSPTLSAPSSGSINEPLSLNLNWGSVATAATYGVQVSTDAAFGSTVVSQTGLTGVSVSISSLATSTTYFWRANAANIGGTGLWSAANSFTTVPPPPGMPALTSPTNNASGQAIAASLVWGTVTSATNYGVEISASAGFGTTIMLQNGLTAASATASGLANATVYYWRADAANAGGAGAWSAAWTFTTAEGKPAVPVLATPTSGSVNQPVTLSLVWNAATGASSYAVQVSTDVNFGSTLQTQSGLSSPSATVNGLANSTTYFWRADASNPDSTSAWSGAWSFTTIIATPVTPTLASPASGTINEPTSVTMNWGTVTGATSYSLMVSTAANFATTVSSQTGLTGTSASLSGLANSTQYYWEVNAANIGGTSGWSGAWSFTTIIATPVTPTLASPASGTINEPTSMTMNWGAVTGAATYSVMVSTAANFTTTVSSQMGLTGTSASLASLANSTQYYWEVNAANVGGTSSWSGAWSFTTIIATPVTPTLASPASGTINEPTSMTMNWGAVTGAATYSVMVSTAANFATTVSSQTGLTGTSASLASLANSTQYYWEVNAANIGGTSGWSGAWSFTTIIATPVAPTLATPASGTINEPTSMTMNWGAVTGAATYSVMVSTVANFATTVSSQTGLTGTSASLASLANSTQYYWEVNATNVGGTSGWSGAWSFTTIIATPVAPTLASPASGTVNEPTSMTMNWGAVTGAATYSVMVSTAANFATTVSSQTGLTGTSASLASLANSTQYYWEVNATNVGGTSGWSGAWSFTTIIATPVAPTLASPASGTVNEPTSMTMTWGAVTGAATYSVMVSTAANFATTVSSQTGLTGTSASLSSLANSTQYYWEVNATNVGGTSGWSGAWSFTTIIATPVAPTLASPANGTVNEPTSMTMTWGAVTGAATYSVLVSTAANFATTVSSQTGLTGTSASLSSLANSTQYYWEVNATNIGGTSGWSGAWSFTTIIATPVAPTLASPASGTVNEPTSMTMTWGAVTGAATYSVLVSTAANFATTVSSQTGLTGTSASLSSLANSTQYYWEVNATNIGGTSGWSGAWSFTTIIATPVAPTLASPASGTVNEPTSMTMNWGAVTGAATYSVMVSTAANFATTVSSQTGLTGTSASLASLANSTQYYWEVNATNVGGTSSWSGAWSFTTIIATPVAPTLATPASGTINEPTSMTMNWGAVTGAATYSVMVSTAANFATTVSSQTGLTGTSASLASLANSTQYYWEVNATNVGGTSGWSGAWSFTTIIATPVAPTLATPASGTINEPTSMTMNWGAVTGAATYSVMVSTAANFATTVSSQTGLTGTSASLSSLANSTQYYWEVNAANIGGTSGWSGAWSFTTIIATPVAPTLASPASGTVNEPTSMTMNWGAVTGAATYSVMVSTAANFATTVSSQMGLTGTSASLSSLANSTQYYWEVNATNVGGTSGWSGAWSFTTIIATPVAPVLATPTSGTVNASTSPTLTWGTVTGAASYSLRVSIQSNFGTIVSSQTGLTGTSASLIGLVNSTQYYWEVNAVNIGGTSNWSGAWSFTTIIALPAQPVLASPTSGAVNQPISLSLTWGTTTNAATYSLMVSTSASFATTVSSQTGLTGVTASLSGLAYSTQYYWEVNAADVGGTGPWSIAWSFTTIIATPIAPVLATPTSGTVNASTSPTLTWGTVTGAASYSLMVSTAANFATTVSSQAGLTGVSASLSGLANSTQYYWEVNAMNAGGTGLWSSVWSFTTIIATPVAPILSYPSNNASGVPTNITISWTSGNGGGSPSTYDVQLSSSSAFSSFIYNGDTASNVVPIWSLANSTTYYWRISAINAGGTSAWSGTWSFTTIIATPGVPVLATPTSGTVNEPTSPTLTWGTVTGAATYSLMVSTAANFATTVSSQTGLTGTSASLSGLANSTQYYWEVNATNVGGTSGWSGAWSFTTIIATPVAPTLASPASGTINEPTSLTMTWGTVTGAATYSVMVSTAANFATTVSSQTGLTGTSASLSGLANSTQYYWEVNAANIGGTSGWSGAWSFTTIIAAPAAPALSSPGNGTGNEPISSLGLIWGASALASSYEVEISTSSSFGNTVFDQTGTGTSATVNGLANSTTYYWRANASNVGGLTWSASWSFTTIIAIPPAPVLATPTNGAINEPVASLGLTWGTAAGASFYEVEVSTSNAFGSTVFDQVSASSVTSATVNGLAFSTTYYWRADASNLAGTGSWATASSFTTVPPAPGTPVLAAPVSGSLNVATSLTMSWGTVAGAASYSVLVSTASNFASTVSSQQGLSGVTASLAGLANSTAYYWEVNAANAGGTSAWSGAWNFTTIIATPVAPALASPSSGAINEPISLTMVWGTVTGAASYSVLVSTASNFASTVSSQQGLTGAAASQSGLANSTLYYWEANAANIGGTSAWSGAWSFTTIIATPVAPALATPTSGAINQPISLSLNWGAVTGAASYSVLVSTASNFATTVASQTGISAVSATVAGLANSVTYYWEVNATNIGGTGAWSGAWSFTTIIAAPAAPVLASPTNGAVGQSVTSLGLSWGTSAGAAQYEVAVSVSSAFGSTILDQTGVTLTMATANGLAYGTTYYWRANASNAGGTTWAAVWSFTTAVLRKVPVTTAWNTISANVSPSGNDSSTTVFGTGPAGDFLFIKDNAGDVYCPALGQDDIHYFQIGQGYQVYSSLPDTFNIAGAPVNPATTAISLTAGWNLISYLPAVPDSIVHALASIESQLVIVKNNGGQVYWPAYNIDNIDSMLPGQGYKMLMSAAASLIYPTPLNGVAKRSALAGNGPALLRLPKPVHYALHVNTGNNATLLAKNVLFGDRTAPDSSEIAAYDVSGNLVGAGTVIHGHAAFAIWGIDPVTKKTNACGPGDKLSFKLWDGSQEYPLDYVAANGVQSKYSTDGVYIGTLAVASGYFIKQFDLTKAYPNPFRGVVKISFDIPAISGMSNQNVELNVYDMRGSLVHQIAKGLYAPGHYTAEWSASENRSGGVGSSIYIVRMKAKNFDKRIKLVKVE